MHGTMSLKFWMGIINSITRLHLVGYFYWVLLRCTDPRILKKLCNVAYCRTYIRILQESPFLLFPWWFLSKFSFFPTRRQTTRTALFAYIYKCIYNYYIIVIYEHIYNYNVIQILVSEEITHSKNFNLLKLAILQSK